SLPAGDTARYVTPPGMTTSPVYSRVAIVRGERTIHISGLYGDPSKGPESEVRDIFSKLGLLLRQSGSDFAHLAKATYYVSSDGPSAKLNELRPEFYDPRRPPAASKAQVRGVGRPGCGIVVDMIAVNVP